MRDFIIPVIFNVAPRVGKHAGEVGEISISHLCAAKPSPSGRPAPKGCQDETIALEIVAAIEDTIYISEAKSAAGGL